MNAHLEARSRQMIESAKHYAAADRSDPFAFRRAMCHIDNGIAGLTPTGSPGHYDAEPYQEERTLPDGRTYMATVYKNMRRP